METVNRSLTIAYVCPDLVPGHEVRLTELRFRSHALGISYTIAPALPNMRLNDPPESEPPLVLQVRAIDDRGTRYWDGGSGFGLSADETRTDGEISLAPLPPAEATSLTITVQHWSPVRAYATTCTVRIALADDGHQPRVVALQSPVVELAAIPETSTDERDTEQANARTEPPSVIGRHISVDQRCAELIPGHVVDITEVWFDTYGIRIEYRVTPALPNRDPEAPPAPPLLADARPVPPLNFLAHALDSLDNVYTFAGGAFGPSADGQQTHGVLTLARLPPPEALWLTITIGPWTAPERVDGACVVAVRLRDRMDAG